MNDELFLDIIDDVHNNNIEALEDKNKQLIKRRNSILNIQMQFIEQENTPKIDVPKNLLSVTKDIDSIDGLWYIKNYLSSKELLSIKQKINDGNIELLPISKTSKSRRVAHYGYYYSYDKTGLKEAPVVPNFLADLVSPDRINKVLNNNLIIVPFEQVIINEYEPGQQIAYHTDHTVLFGPIVACITIGQEVPIKFKLGNTEKVVNIEEGSMYIMTGNARYKWQHSLRNNADSNTWEYNLPFKGQGNRYSITYRTINK